MPNPFEKRATEYLRDDEAFLAVVTPEPLVTFFEKPAKEDRLYDRLAMVIGTPGSGKTTIARLFQVTTLFKLIENRQITSYRPLLDALSSCGAIEDERPAVVGARIPLEAEYREFWEFPYPDDLKNSLMIALLQARTILAWFRGLQAAGIDVNNIEVRSRDDAEAALSAIGGHEVPALIERARDVELTIYRIAAALVPPKLEDLNLDAATIYRPFDVIKSIRLKGTGPTTVMKPLVIFDDAHTLHPSQLVALQRWLTGRSIQVGRWILMRLDALTPRQTLLDHHVVQTDTAPGIKATREITDIWLQGSADRKSQRRAFRRMARDMAGRYLRKMEVFERRGLRDLSDLLASDEPVGAASEKLRSAVNLAQRRCGVSAERRKELESKVDLYMAPIRPDEALSLSVLAILFERYAKRVPQGMLFAESDDDPDPRLALTVDSGVVDGARVQLMHHFGRPYYSGIDSVSDASSENAEQFLQLTSRLVAQAETQLIRGRSATLRPSVQDKLLQERATEMLAEWNFPQHRFVRRLADGIAKACVERSLEPNAPLGGGANAFGIPQAEFDVLPETDPELARVLQFGVAYNALSLVTNYGTKKKLWCLIELGGVLIVHHRLTLRRGGFLERKVSDLGRLAFASDPQ